MVPPAGVDLGGGPVVGEPCQMTSPGSDNLHRIACLSFVCPGGKGTHLVNGRGAGS